MGPTSSIDSMPIFESAAVAGSRITSYNVCYTKLLRSFASFNGADFYRLPRNTGTVTLERQACTVPEKLPYGAGEELVPMRAGEAVAWKLVG